MMGGFVDCPRREPSKTYKTECIQAVLLAQRHLDLEIKSAEELHEYRDDDGFFTLSRVSLEPNRKRGPEVLLKIHVGQRAGRSPAEAIFGQRNPAAAARPQDVQSLWAQALGVACRRGVSPHAFNIGPDMAVLFCHETNRRPEDGAGPAPVEDRLGPGDAAAAALDPPDWPAVERSSDYQRAEAIWNYCVANDCDTRQKVARVWETWARLFRVKPELADGEGTS